MIELLRLGATVLVVSTPRTCPRSLGGRFVHNAIVRSLSPVKISCHRPGTPSQNISKPSMGATLSHDTTTVVHKYKFRRPTPNELSLLTNTMLPCVICCVQQEYDCMEVKDTHLQIVCRPSFLSRSPTAALRHTHILACALPEYPCVPHLTSSRGVPMQGVESCRWPSTVFARSLGIDGNNE